MSCNVPIEKLLNKCDVVITEENHRIPVCCLGKKLLLLGPHLIRARHSLSTRLKKIF